MTQSQSIGRPRSERARQAVLDAAFEAMAEEGFQRASIEGIARRAGASKATVYRWWPTKAAVVLEAVQEHSSGYPKFTSTGDVRSDLVDEVRAVIRFYATDAGSAVLDLISASRHDSALAANLRTRFIADRRRDAAVLLQSGIASGEFPPDLDVDTIMDMIWGSIYYRLLVHHEPTSESFADRIVDRVWPALIARSAAGRANPDADGAHADERPR